MGTKELCNKGQSVQFLFTMVLLFTLAISALFTILFGARIYENIGQRMEENFSSTMALSYISNKIKQNDKEDKVSIVNIEGITALKLIEDYDGQVYNTLIYCKNGNLKELFVNEENELTLDDGIDIMEIQNISFKKIRNNLIKVEIADDSSNSLLLSLRSEVNDNE